VDEQLIFMDYLWVQTEDDLVTVGVNEEGLEGFDQIEGLNLPTENTEVVENEVCGELETDQGPFNLYSPLDGTIIEINETVVQNPKLIVDDPLGDGWLFRVEPSNPSDLENLAERLKGLDDEQD